MAQPDLILKPFGAEATAGTINVIPDERPSGAAPQLASWSLGFPLITMTYPGAGGLPPFGQDMNGVLNAISQHTVYLGGGGLYKWSSAYVAAAGGYSKGAVVQSNDGLNSYVSLVDGNATDFNTTPSEIGVSWQIYSGQSLIQAQATETSLGVVRIATTPIALAGTDDFAAMTSLKVKRAIDQKLPFVPVQQGGGIGQATNKLYLGYAPTITRPTITVDGTNYGGIAFLDDLAVMPITKQFLSTQQAFVNGGLVSVSHGLGVMPKIVMGELVCLVAENGWQVGDVQVISLSPDNDDSAVITGFAVRKDSVTIYARCGVSGPYGVNINTGATAVPTAANWRLVLRAFA